MDGNIDYKLLKYMMSVDPKSKLERICFVHNEDKDNYIGNWVVGFGEMNEKFPKADTRKMSSEEIKNYNNADFCKTKGIHFPLSISEGGKIEIRSNIT